jgi:hypothetical protein
MDHADLIAALHRTGPTGPHADRLMLFGQFVGSWDIAWSGLDADGGTGQMQGELHFGWVLGGRAVQDIWIVSGDGPGLRGFHGTTVRLYDPAIDAWRSTWIDPLNNRVRRFIGRPVDGDIVLISDEEEPRLRWSFTGITPRSFTWRGEISRHGQPWSLEEEMAVTRVA